MSKIQFGFYYGAEAEQFSFYRVPRLLIRDERFRGLSSDAKLLYGLMLDRMALSQKNNWFDEENRAYIIYTIENMQEDLGCSKPTIIKVMRELDESGIGLIQKKRRGLGKPDIIYVKNFASLSEEEVRKEPEKAASSAEVKDFDFQKSRNFTSGSQETLPQEVKNFDSQKSESFTSGGQESLRQEVKNLAPSYTDKNYTDLSYTDMSKKESIHPSEPAAEDVLPGTDAMDTIEALRQQIRQNINYDRLVSDGGYLVKKYAPEIYRLICDIVCIPQNVVRIARADCPYSLVRERFLQLTGEDVEYVVECMSRTSRRIDSIRAYLLTALYNASTSREHFYRAEANCKVQQDGGVAAFEAFAAKDG